MNQEHRDVIHDVLENCSKNNKMDAGNVEAELYKRGMITIVIKDPKDARWRNRMLYSYWESDKHGLYLILMAQYKPSDVGFTKIRCNHKVDRMGQQRSVVAETSKYYVQNEGMEPDAIGKRYPIIPIWKVSQLYIDLMY